jgi:hypothetical protein
MPIKDSEKRKQYNKEYHKKNKERRKEYNQKNPHINKISDWKQYGIKLKPNEDWESIYLFYITCENCEECAIELTDEKVNTATHRCLDHDHDTGFIRNILCHSCNTKRG